MIRNFREFSEIFEKFSRILNDSDKQFDEIDINTRDIFNRDIFNRRIFKS